MTLGVLTARSGKDFFDRPLNVLLTGTREQQPEVSRFPALHSVMVQEIVPSCFFPNLELVTLL